MKKILKIALEVVVWAALVCYTVFAVRLCSEREEQVVVERVVITVADSAREGLVTSQTVAEWLSEDYSGLVGTPLAEIDTDRMDSLLESRPFVSRAGVYSLLDGTISVTVAQYRPIARVRGEGGYDFYISGDRHIIPFRAGSSVYVPLITGEIPLPFGPEFTGSIESLPDTVKKSDPGYAYLLKLINFVELLAADEFWSAQLVQIDLRGTGNKAVRRNGAGRDFVFREPEAELVTRVGNHTVMMGTIDDAREKLDKLMLFYEKVLAGEGWDAYRTISLKYRGQVVCRK